MHRDNSPFIQLKMWRPLSSAEGKRWGEEKATAIQNHNLDSLFCFLRACGERRGGLLCPPGLKALQCTRLFLHRCVKKGPHRKKKKKKHGEKDAVGATVWCTEDTRNDESKNAEQRILSPSQRGFISVGYIWTEDASPVAGGRHAGWVITFFSFLFLFFFFLLWQRGNQSSLYA